MMRNYLLILNFIKCHFSLYSFQIFEFEGFQLENFSNSKMGVKSLFARGSVLFLIGNVFALVLELLQIQRQVTPQEVLPRLFSEVWWVAPCCGTAAGKSILS